MSGLPSNSCLVMLLLLLIADIYIGLESTNDSHHQLNEFIRHYEPLHVYQLSSVEESDKKRFVKNKPGPWHLSFAAFGRTFDIQLYSNTRIFKEAATIQVIGSNDTTHNLIDSSHLCQGYVEGDPGSHVHGHIHNGIFSGIIKTHNDSLHLEPSQRYFNKSQSFHSIVYKESDVIFPRTGVDRKSRQVSPIDNPDSILKVQHQPYVHLHDPSTKADSDIFASLNYNNSNLPPILQPISNNDDTAQSRHWSNSYPPLAKEANASRTKNATKQSMNETSPLAGETSSTTVRTCNLHIVIDHTFFLAVASDVMQSLAEVAYHIEEADIVYRATDFNGDGVGDNVGLSIDAVTIFESPDSEYYLLSDSYDEADEYLSQFALYNFDAFCLGIVFTSVDFNEGVLGLAWIGYASIYGPPGGICQQRVVYRNDGRPSSLNTALVSNINHGSKLPRQVTSITVMHEIGHAFGSLHDPVQSSCSPDGSYGNYIMFSMATDGDKPFNTQFSPCSTSEMAPVIASKGPHCFKFYSGPYCGNKVVEDGEECDCGTAAQCLLKDVCCTPQGGMETDGECTFRRGHGSTCSPYSSGCCDYDCKLIKASSHHVCLEETECEQQSVCHGDSVECPSRMLKPNGTHCSNTGNGKTCLNGKCQLSVCSTLGLFECKCSGDLENMCHVCCQVDSICTPVSSIDTSGFYNVSSIITMPVGSSCHNYTGYCDADGQCISVDSDTALHRLRELFTRQVAKDIGEWMQINWYYIVAFTLGTALLSTFFTILHRHVASKQSNRHMTQRAVRLAAVWNQARQQKSKIAEERQRVAEGLRSHTMLLKGGAGFGWLRQLFPTAYIHDVVDAAQASSNDKEAMMKLLAKGYGMKKVPIHLDSISKL